LRARIRTLAHERRRFGYRRLFVLLRRDRKSSGKNRIYRLSVPIQNTLPKTG
jgi:transposase InsO family protein